MKKIFPKINLAEWGGIIAKFLREVIIEVKKVSWPSRQQTIQHTLIVIGVSAAVAIFLGGADFLFVMLLNRFVF